MKHQRNFTLRLLLAVGLSGVLEAHAQDPGPGSVDESYNATVSGPVYCAAVQTDSKVVIGGVFGTVGGQTRYGIARLNTDGSVDTNFVPTLGIGGRGAPARQIAFSPDGKIFVAGGFDQVNGQARVGLARLNEDGSLDPTFDAHYDGGGPRIAVQADGKVVVTYYQRNGGGISPARLNADGSLDTSFDPGSGPSNSSGTPSLATVVVQTDGKVLIGGIFEKVDGFFRTGIARLNTDGSVDTTFGDPNLMINEGTPGSGRVNNIALQTDGKIVIQGYFTDVNGTPRRDIARLNSNGTVDASFDAGNLTASREETIASQPDRKLLVGGSFTTFNGVPRTDIVRLNTDGSVDTEFNYVGGSAGELDEVDSITLKPDGDIIIASRFSVANDPRLWIARLHGGAAPPKADLLIRKENEPLAGDDVYQTSPSGIQLLSEELSPGAVLKYTIKLQNETGQVTAFRLRSQAPLNNTGWAFRSMFGQSDISAAVSSAEGWQTPSLAPQEEIAISLQAQPNVAEADETAQLRFFLAKYDAPATTLDALGIDIERSDTIVVNVAGDADDASPADGSPDVQPNTDGVQITLRSAINFSNRKTARETIEFNVPGSAVPLISPTSALPAISAPAVLAGDSSSGGKTELDGSAAGEADGLNIQTEDCVVRGFVIHSFDKSGIEIGGTGSNKVEGCFIGTDVSGRSARTNRHHGIHIVSPKNTIGGSAAKPGSAPGNLISGNGYGDFNGINGGIFTEGEQANENVVIGNLIGTDVTGKVALGNEEIGIGVGGAGNRIGGTTAQERNIVSGNSLFGIDIGSPGAKGNMIVGNFVGTDISGTAGIPNGEMGVFLEAGASENFIGGTAAGSRNVVAGNGNGSSTNAKAGIGISAFANKNKVQGNYIGLDVTGAKALGNVTGVIIAGAGQNTIGGPSSAARNVISGNAGAGVQLGFEGTFTGTGQNNTVTGNFIGPDKTGTRAIPNAVGVLVTKKAGSNTIGGNSGQRRNVISGNTGAGLIFTSGASVQNHVLGNLIGTGHAGVRALGNGGPGIWVKDFSQVEIGRATPPGSGNRIAFNQGPGVFIEKGRQNVVVGNSISDNSGLGIDLGVQGRTLNDAADSDRGANLLQNFPQIEGLTRLPSGTRIQGRLDSRGAAGDQFYISFYTTPSGASDGEEFIGYAAVTANPAGPIVFDVTLPVVITSGLYLTGTATDQNGNTSEFSDAVLVR